MVDASRKVEILGSSAKMIGLAFLAAIMTALSLALALRVPPVFVDTSDFAMIVGWVGAVFFGLCLVMIVWRGMTQHGPVVTLSKDGWIDTRVSAALVPWPSVLGIGEWSASGQKVIVVSVDPQVEATLPLTRIARWTRAANAQLGADGLCVTAQGLKMGHDELMGMFQAYASAHRT